MIDVNSRSPSYILIALIAAVFFLLLLPLSRPFPYADDWMYVAQANEYAEMFFLKSLFVSHNEHFIPLQNLLHLALLKLSGLDFRVLIGFNVLCTALISFLWVNILYSSLDGKGNFLSYCIIPMIAMNWGFNTVNWGFNFQFISGVLFVSYSIYSWVEGIKTKSLHCYKIFISLILCNLCGANGLIESTVIGSGFLLAIILFKPVYLKSKLNIICIILWVLLTLILIRETALNIVSDVPHAVVIHETINFYLGLIGSWLGIYGARRTGVDNFLLVLLPVIPLIYCGFSTFATWRKSQLNEISLYSYSIFLVVAQAIALCVVISFSRASIQPWWPGLELHYGYLFITIPFAAVYMVMQLKSDSVKYLISFALFILCGSLFLSNSYWRISVAKTENKKFIQASEAILSAKSSRVVAKEFIKEFYWGFGEEEVNVVASGIDSIRKRGIWAD
jgi:hypothetical protein